MGASLGNLGEGSYAGGLCMEEGSGTGVSSYRGPVQGPREGGGVVYLELWEVDEGGSRDGASLSLWRGSLKKGLDGGLL